MPIEFIKNCSMNYLINTNGQTHENGKELCFMCNMQKDEVKILLNRSEDGDSEMKCKSDLPCNFRGEENKK
jgi:hypothetical protein